MHYSVRLLVGEAQIYLTLSGIVQMLGGSSLHRHIPLKGAPRRVSTDS